MTYVYKPCGRGSWTRHEVRITYQQTQRVPLPAPTEQRIGSRITLYGVELRLARIEP